MVRKISFVLLFTLMFLMLLNNYSFGYSMSDFPNVTFSPIPDYALEAIENTPEYQSGDYSFLFYNKYNLDFYEIYFIQKSDLPICVKLNDYGSASFKNISGTHKIISYRLYYNSTSVSDRYDFLPSGYYYTDVNSFPNSIFYSDTNIYLSEECEDFFFSPPREGVNLLQEVVKEVEMEKTLAEVVMILPIVMTLLISIIAFRKAWAFLKVSLVS